MAKGDLSRKIEIEADGEIAELKTTINIMVRAQHPYSWTSILMLYVTTG